MGMTIDNSLELFEDNFTVINTHGHYTEEEEIQATEIAIETMRKYEKIVQIMERTVDDGTSMYDTLQEIEEVIEDGSDKRL